MTQSVKSVEISASAINAVARANSARKMNVLKCLISAGPSGAKVKDIVAATGLSRSQTNQALYTLERQGLVASSGGVQGSASSATWTADVEGILNAAEAQLLQEQALRDGKRAAAGVESPLDRVSDEFLLIPSIFHVGHPIPMANFRPVHPPCTVQPG